MTDASDMARALAARRPTITIICEVCGEQKTVTAMQGRNAPRTCSNRCRQALYRRERAPDTRDH